MIIASFIYANYHELFSYETLNVKHVRGVKMNDIYIYPMHILSLLFACLHNKHRRGRLYFQEREDDMDMTILDTTGSITYAYIYQVIYSCISKIYYLFIKDRITTYQHIICRYIEDLFIPRVKMRLWMVTCIIHALAGVIVHAKHEAISMCNSGRWGSPMLRRHRQPRTSMQRTWPAPVRHADAPPDTSLPHDGPKSVLSKYGPLEQ
jgi:hypothetical protein